MIASFDSLEFGYSSRQTDFYWYIRLGTVHLDTPRARILENAGLSARVKLLVY